MIQANMHVKFITKNTCLQLLQHMGPTPAIYDAFHTIYLENHPGEMSHARLLGDVLEEVEFFLGLNQLSALLNKKCDSNDLLDFTLTSELKRTILIKANYFLNQYKNDIRYLWQTEVDAKKSEFQRTIKKVCVRLAFLPEAQIKTHFGDVFNESSIVAIGELNASINGVVAKITGKLN